MATTTRERMETLVKEIEAITAPVNDAGRDFKETERADVDSKTRELQALTKQFRDSREASQAAADAVREVGSLADATDAVKSIHEVDKLDDGRRANPAGKTLGELFTESPEFSEFLGKYAGRDGLIPNSTKGLMSRAFQSNAGVKALITGGSATSAGALVENDRLSSITDMVPFRERTILDVITRGSTGSDTVEYVQVTSKTNNAATVAEALVSDAPTAPGGAGALVQAPTGGYKPESTMALAVVATTVKTLAHWMAITKRAASDAAQIMTLVNNFLAEGLFDELEDQIIGGNNTGENFNGLLNSVTQTVGSAGTDLDAVVDAISTVRVTGRSRPTAIVLHPNDWYSTGFLTAKDSQLRYMIGDPRASVDALNTLWGLQVIVSEGITENTALVGDFRQAVLWEREGVSLSMTDSHEDFFTRNLLAVLAEMRAAFGVLKPQAFCKITAV